MMSLAWGTVGTDAVLTPACSLKQVLALTERIAQSLSLLAVLQHKGVHLLSVKLDEEQRAALARTTLQSWAVRRDGDALAHMLMWALLNEEQGASGGLGWVLES